MGAAQTPEKVSAARLYFTFLPFMAEQIGNRPSAGTGNWGTWVNPDAQGGTTATVKISVNKDGVCKIVVGGTAETPDWNRWKANASYGYEADPGEYYYYRFQAWTESGTRTVNVQYYWDDNGTPQLNSDDYDFGELKNLTTTPTDFIIFGKEIPNGGPHSLGFQCADQTGTFYVKVLGIDKYTPNLTYIPNGAGTEYTVTGIYGRVPTSGTVAIPPTWDGLPVVAIANNAFATFSDKGDITSVEIPSSVKTIGQDAFSGCNNLETITFTGTIPSELETVGVSAFDGCTSLDTITFSGGAPTTLTTIGDYAFRGTSLSAAPIPAGVTSIGTGAFRDTAITNVSIPASVNSIGTYAFANNNSLTSVSFIGISALTTINEGVFYDTNIISITIPASVTSIGDKAFFDCSSLTTVTLSTSLTTIGTSAFNGCNDLTNISLPASLTTIGSEAFNGCTSITEITIPAAVTTIGVNAFAGWGPTQTIRIPFTPTAIPTGWDTNWKGGNPKIIDPTYFTQDLTYTFVPGSPGTYTVGAYTGTDTIVIIPDTYDDTGKPGAPSPPNGPGGVTAIAANAFQNGPITSIDIPASVTSIGNNAFSGCTALKTVNYAPALAFDDWFAGLDITTVNITGNTTILNGALMFCAELTTVNIPHVTTIGNGAFHGCTSLASITLPTGLTSIGNDAFKESGLTSIVISDTVTSIGGGVFSRCTALTTIAIDSTNPNYTGVGGALYNKAQTQLIAYPAAIGNVTIPSTVTVIGEQAFELASLTGVTFTGNVTTIDVGAFYYSGLTAIEIPASVTTINYEAFKGCTGLATVDFVGTSTLTVIPGGAFEGCTNLTAITIPTSVTTINANAFRGTGLTSIIIPANVAIIDGNPFPYCASLATITVDTGNASYKTAGGILYDISETEIIACLSTTTTVTIPVTVTDIGDNAFEGCTSVSSINIPATVTAIGDNAFAGWVAAQTITINGYANEAAADTALGGNSWRDECSATITYVP